MVGRRGGLGTCGLAVRRTGLALIGVLSTGLLWSCAGSSTGGDDLTTGPVSESAFPQTAADALCGNLANCCATAGIPYERAGCEAYVVDALEREPPANTTWDSVQAGKCIDWFAHVASACFEVDSGQEQCADIYRGTLPEGAVCLDSQECADIRGSDATCTYDDITLSGTCALEVEPARGRSGDVCVGTCSSSSDGGSCIGFGSPAEVSTVCHVEDGLVCSFSSGVCVPPPVVGENCNDAYCAAGAYCSSFELICRPVKPDGEACESDEECNGGSCVDFLCGPRSVASSELCSGQ